MSERSVVVCFTCCVTGPQTAETVWNNSWDVSNAVEEDQAIAHARLNPTHILVRGMDFGQFVIDESKP